MTGMLCDRIGLMIGFGMIGVLASRTQIVDNAENEFNLRVAFEMIAIWMVLVCASFLPSMILIDKSEWIWPWSNKHKS